MQVPNPQNHSEAPPPQKKFPTPLSPIMGKTEPTLTVPVTVTSTPINAEEIICIEDKILWSKKLRDRTEDTSSSPPSSQTAPAAEAPDRQQRRYNGNPPLPQDLDVIKEFIQRDKDYDYIPLMSAIETKK